MPSGETIGPRPGAHPRNCPSGSWTVSDDMPSNPGWPSWPSRRRDAACDRRGSPRDGSGAPLVRNSTARTNTSLAAASGTPDCDRRLGSRVERVRAGRRQDRVRRAELPAVGEDRRLRQVGGTALRACPARPALDVVDLIVGSRRSPRIGNSPGSGSHGGMWRSRVSSADGAGMFHGVGIGEQRKRRRLPGPMARRAIGEDDRRDVPGERRRRRGAAPRPSVRERTDGGGRRDPREAAHG